MRGFSQSIASSFWQKAALWSFKISGHQTDHHLWMSLTHLAQCLVRRSRACFRCKCSSAFTFYCVVTNEVEDGHIYSEFYRKPGKQYSSRLVSRSISMSPFVGEEQRAFRSLRANSVIKDFHRLAGVSNTLLWLLTAHIRVGVSPEALFYFPTSEFARSKALR